MAGIFSFFALRMRTTPSGRDKPVQRAEAQSSGDQRLQKFSLSGFDNTGNRFWNLQGETAKIDPSQTAFLDDNVTLKLKDGTLIRTDKVLWSQQEGFLKTRSKVYVHHASAKITGMGAYGRPADNIIQLNHDIEMLINAETHLWCDGPMKIFYNENKMVFYRKVHVKDASGHLWANRMDVFFDQKTNQILQIVAVGDVRIERAGDTTRSRRAYYDPKTGSVRLEGSPEITLQREGGGFLEAERSEGN